MYAIDSRDGYQQNLNGVHLSYTQNVSDSSSYTSKQDAIEINLQVPLRYDNTLMNSESKTEKYQKHSNYKDGNNSFWNLNFESIFKMDKSKRISNEEIKNQLSIISSYKDKPSDSHISKISKTSEDFNVWMNQNKYKNIIRRWSRELDRKAFEFLSSELSKINKLKKFNM